MAAGSSRGTSEIASVSRRAGCAAAASLPPLMRDRCLRTQFISLMRAPERRSCLVSVCLASKLTPATGADQRGGAARHQRENEVVRAGRGGKLERALGAFDAVGVRDRVSRLDDLDRVRRQPVSVACRDEPRDQVLLTVPDVVALGRARHRGGGLAGADDDDTSPSGTGGRCGGTQVSGCAVATAASYISMRSLRVCGEPATAIGGRASLKAATIAEWFAGWRGSASSAAVDGGGQRDPRPV